MGISYLNIYENKFYNIAAVHNEMYIIIQVLGSVQINISEKD
jgi:hypothetical protein